MCNCIKETEERVKSMLSEKNASYKDKKVLKVSIVNTAILFDVKQSLQMVSPVEIEYETVNKKNEIVHKKDKSNFTFQYCPFCGEKYE